MIEGKLIPSSLGCGSAYFLLDSTGTARYVVKPVDEDVFCLNNRELGSIFNDLQHRVARRDSPVSIGPDRCFLLGNRLFGGLGENHSENCDEHCQK